jgi:hypothetical protein
MSDRVAFVLRDWPSRHRNPGLCYGSSGSRDDNEERSPLEPIPQFANSNPIPLGRWGSRVDTRALPSSPRPCSLNTFHSQNSDAEDEYSDPEIEASDSEDEDVALPLQPAMKNRHERVTFHALNVDDLSDEAARLTQEGCDEGTDYHSQVRLIAKKLRESRPPMPWAGIGHIFGLNGGTIFQHVTEERWTFRPTGRPPSLTPEELLSLRAFLTDQFAQGTPASYADINDFIFIETGKSIPANTVRHMISRLQGFKTAVGIPTEAKRVESDPREIDAHFDRLERI